MSDTTNEPRARQTRTRSAEPTAIDQDLIGRVIQETLDRQASRPNPMALDTWEQLENFAVRTSRSEMVPKDYRGKPDNVILAIMKGREIGLPPIQALESIAIVNGRSAVWGDAIKALCWASGKCEDIRERFEGQEGSDNYTAICEAKRKGATVSIGRFSQGDAKKAGLFGKAVHGQYPKRMMQRRAAGYACHDAFPDVLLGIAIREIEAEDAVATPGWTMPAPEKSWYDHKPTAQSDGWNDTWYRGAVSQLANEPNAWRWLDILMDLLADAPTLRDVNEIGDLPMVETVKQTAPDEAKKLMEDAFVAAKARLAITPAAKAPESRQPDAPVRQPDPASEQAKPVDRQPDPVKEPDPPADDGIDRSFAEYLVDGDGDPIADEDGVIERITDPVAWCHAYVEARLNVTQEEAYAMADENAAAIKNAMRVSTRTARILADGDDKLRQLNAPVSEGAATVAFDPSVTKPATMGKADLDAFHEALKARVVQATDPGQVHAVREANAVTVASLPNKRAAAAGALYDARLKVLTPEDQRDAKAETVDELFASLMGDIEDMKTTSAIDRWMTFDAAQGERDRLLALSADVHAKVMKAAEDRRETVMTPQETADALKATISRATTIEGFRASRDTPVFMLRWNRLMNVSPPLWEEVKTLGTAKAKELNGTA